MQLRNVKIGMRAGCTFTFLAVLILLMGLVSLFQAKQMDAATDGIREDWLPAIIALGEVGTSLGRARALTLRSVLLNDVSERQRSLDLIESVNKTMPEHLGAYEKTITLAQDRELFDHFIAQYKRYLALQTEIVAAVAAGRIEEAERLVNGPLAEYADTMMKALTTLIRFNSEGAYTSAQGSSEAFTEAVTVVVVALVVILLVMTIIAILLTRSIVAPMAEAVEVANRVASGDLTQEIRVEGHDEPAMLLSSLRTMQQSLRDTIRQISSASDQLASASEELHAVTEDTSRGLHQQSAEIDQAATAVNQMTVAVEEVASNASSTADASQVADQTTLQGRDQVKQALESIRALASDVTVTSEEIGQLANQVNEIGQVLDVIGAIADQTNLLALNAAIEAARAGDAGRGFAVVADEVRALAHRTQASTKEIGQMIGGIQSGSERAVGAIHSSQNRANNTLEVAQAAGAALEVIASSISSINERNLVIASASEEQAQVAREVDRNLVNIRDLSTQTSAGANQTSAASQDLSRLAVELNAMVSKFRT
ncbi:methyl-accepting chemotaxis protein [Pseudomonas sp.]|uniref:methyl-accepting chemotaxis protein n=1 Tax=Pseudomonas sp. TaxID=306 RepID=UPI003D6FB62C